MARTKTKPKGQPFKHGGYSLMVRRGSLPEKMTRVRKYLSEVREGLVRDIAGQEENLTTAQLVLIDRAVSLLSVIRTIEYSLSEKGIMEGTALQPILRENYLAYSNSLRLILRELGVDKRSTADVLDLGRYIAEADAKEAAQAKVKEKSVETVSLPTTEPR
jgi:hypothetical protein